MQLYLISMFRNPNKLLIAVLVLLLGVGRAGSVLAGPHSCMPGTGQGMAVDGMVHGDHARVVDMNDTRAVPQSGHGCVGCSKNCCHGGHCSMGHCAGTLAIFPTSTELRCERPAACELTATDDRPFAGQFTPPFRPPRA